MLVVNGTGQTASTCLLLSHGHGGAVMDARCGYNGGHAGAPLAQDRVDCLGDRLGPVLLEAIRPAKLPLLLRSGKSLRDARPVAGEPSAFLLAGDRTTAVQTLYTIDLAGAF